jgi:glyceraldehyde 3-phosphate dehydrogenase
MRAALEYPDVTVEMINSSASAEEALYRLKYDSVHGAFGHEVTWYDEGHSLLVGKGECEHVVAIRNESSPRWRQASSICNDGFKGRYIVEATGKFKTVAAAMEKHTPEGDDLRYWEAVVITAPSEDAPTFVMGVNEQDYTPDMSVVSNASCTTNALAPMVKVLHEKWGVESALMTTIHAATASQNVVDGSSGKDWRGGRATAVNMIPATTGAATAVAKVLPSLAGRITGMSMRVPTIDVSCVDLTVNLEKPASYKEICAEMKRASEEELKGILGYTEDAVVSSDFIHDPRSVIFDATAGMQLTDRFVKFIAWYDNEWAYSKRVVDLIRHMHKRKYDGR